ncbi:hypothetical protein [Jiella pacifica]|uniref:hypothetical protein n=1 Tax=Jiella pacifica TaxID=2696469 RepID=UPI0019402EB6|nr:hypothetical protein [Jiella pacifica]
MLSVGDVFASATGLPDVPPSKPRPTVRLAPPEAANGPKRKRAAPFSIRLSEEERAQLAREAGGEPLGTYIRVKVLDGSGQRKRRTGQPIEDRKALARLLGLLGKSELGAHLAELASAARSGSLPVDPETQTQLQETLADVRELRRLLMEALGLQMGGAAP